MRRSELAGVCVQASKGRGGRQLVVDMTTPCSAAYRARYTVRGRVVALQSGCRKVCATLTRLFDVKHGCGRCMRYSQTTMMFGWQEGASATGPCRVSRNRSSSLDWSPGSCRQQRATRVIAMQGACKGGISGDIPVYLRRQCYLALRPRTCSPRTWSTQSSPRHAGNVYGLAITHWAPQKRR